MDLGRKCAAEFVGTGWLVFGGCGSAVIAAGLPNTIPHVGIGYLGVALAFGLTVLTMACAIGHISGCHLNPAVTLGLFAGGRCKWTDVVPYIIAQVLGGIAGAGLLYVIVSGKPGFNLAGSGFACNGFGDHSPGKYSLIACFVAEFALTFAFLFVIHGATDRRAPTGIAPIGIGLCLTLIHLIGIDVTNLSVNPARSTGPALILALIGGEWWAISQVWLFWAAPIAGAVVGAIAYCGVAGEATKS
jgi:aquaporin Z